MTQDDRKAPCRCGSGRKYKVCCLPADRARVERREAARAGHRAIDEVMKIILPLVESRGEHAIACKAGCNACCSQLVWINRPEALPIAEFLRQPENLAARARFERGLPSLMAAAGADLEEVDQLLRRHGPPPQPENPAAREQYAAAAQRYQSRAQMCLFNDEQGNCAVYPVRPIICRAFVVVDTAEFCDASKPRTQGPPVVRHPAIDTALAESRRAMERSSTRSGEPLAACLTTTVAALLASDDK